MNIKSRNWWLMLALYLCLHGIVQAAPQIQHWTTEKGLRVYFVPAPDLPMLDIQLLVAAGGAHDGEKMGLASLTNGMLDQGADGMSSDEIALAFDSVGASFGSGSARDSAWVSLRTLTFDKEMETALSTWLRLLQKPDFPAKEFKNLQKLTLVSLDAEKQSPGSIGSKAFWSKLYNKHPYAQPTAGTADSINAMTLSDLRSFYERYYVAKNAVLALVGAVTREQVEVLANKVSDALVAGEKAEALPETKPLTTGEQANLVFPSEQSHIRMGVVGVKRSDQERYALQLGNHILGGAGFTSRLVKEVRQNRGLSYSVSSYFISMEEKGPFMISLQTQQDKTQEALQVVRDELKKFLEQGPTEAELVAAKKDLTGSFPMSVASNSDIVGQLGSIGFYDLPLDTLDTYISKINALTREDIMKAFRQHIDPDKMLTVVVGQAADTEAQDAPKNSK